MAADQPLSEEDDLSPVVKVGRKKRGSSEKVNGECHFVSLKAFFIERGTLPGAKATVVDHEHLL